MAACSLGGTTMAQYDAIATMYAKVHHQPTFAYAFNASFLELVGDVRGKTVLDLACGAGRITFELLERGVKSVLGVDESGEMLKIARQDSRARHVKFLHAKVGEMGKVGTFDIITASWLLHYSASKDELRRMCDDIVANMADDGVFYCINNNPLSPLSKVEKYDDCIEAKGPLREGDTMRITHMVDGVPVWFYIHFWHLSTYERILFEAGLNVDFIMVSPSEEGVRLYGHEFWHEFITNPTAIMMRCTKR